jgi:hypothetical protein
VRAGERADPARLDRPAAARHGEEQDPARAVGQAMGGQPAVDHPVLHEHEVAPAHDRDALDHRREIVVAHAHQQRVARGPQQRLPAVIAGHQRARQGRGRSEGAADPSCTDDGRPLAQRRDDTTAGAGAPLSVSLAPSADPVDRLASSSGAPRCSSRASPAPSLLRAADDEVCAPGDPKNVSRASCERGADGALCPGPRRSPRVAVDATAASRGAEIGRRDAVHRPSMGFRTRR